LDQVGGLPAPPSPPAPATTDTQAAPGRQLRNDSRSTA